MKRYKQVRINTEQEEKTEEESEVKESTETVTE